MSAIDNTPTNRNFLSPLNFRFQIKKAPHINFFLQKVNIPQIYLKQVDTSNPFVTTPYPGEHINFSPLKIEFKVDESMQDYLEISNWIKALGKPETFQQYKDIQDKPSYTGDSIYSDISLIVLTSTKMHNYDITFVDSFPTTLSELTFNTTDEDVRYITASAEFKYTYYTVNSI
jgi:hypothetical protein